MSPKKSIIRKIDTGKLSAIEGILLVLIFMLLVVFGMGTFLFIAILIRCETIPDIALAIWACIGFSYIPFSYILEATSNELLRRSDNEIKNEPKKLN